jgi:hypothetical protein
VRPSFLVHLSPSGPEGKGLRFVIRLDFPSGTSLNLAQISALPVLGSPGVLVHRMVPAGAPGPGLGCVPRDFASEG